MLWNNFYIWDQKMAKRIAQIVNSYEIETNIKYWEYLLLEDSYIDCNIVNKKVRVKDWVKLFMWDGYFYQCNIQTIPEKEAEIKRHKKKIQVISCYSKKEVNTKWYPIVFGWCIYMRNKAYNVADCRLQLVWWWLATFKWFKNRIFAIKRLVYKLFWIKI